MSDELKFTKDTDTSDGTKLRTYINNYVNFYHKEHGVPVGEIFSSAAVSREDIERLLKFGEPKLRIYLAKTNDSCNYEKMTFIIAPADMEGKTFLEKQGFTEAHSEDCCCRNPD